MKRTYRQTTQCMSFNRALLPMPIVILQKLRIQPGKANYAGYWQLYCPFHKSGHEQHPSLNLHTVQGHFRCHACGAKGGDILSFYMQVTGKRFSDAAKELGAWRNTDEK
jgi:DNA primase